jgi:hypothetical protein
MAARGLKIWMLAELDNARLSVKRLFAGKPAPAAPREIPVEEQ